MVRRQRFIHTCKKRRRQGSRDRYVQVKTRKRKAYAGKLAGRLPAGESPGKPLNSKSASKAFSTIDRRLNGRGKKGWEKLGVKKLGSEEVVCREPP